MDVYGIRITYGNLLRLSDITEKLDANFIRPCGNFFEYKVTVGIDYGTAFQGIQKGNGAGQTFFRVRRNYVTENDVCFRIYVMMIVCKSNVHPTDK